MNIKYLNFIRDDGRPIIFPNVCLILPEIYCFSFIFPLCRHLLNNLEVGRFGSSYTIMNANDGQIIVNTTNQLSDLYTRWNQSVHLSRMFFSPISSAFIIKSFFPALPCRVPFVTCCIAHANARKFSFINFNLFFCYLFDTVFLSITDPLGLNLPNVLRVLRNQSMNLLEHERATSSVGGRSHIALIIPQAAAVNEGDSNFAVEQLRIFREDIPDLRVMFWSAGSPNRFERFVREPARDLYPLRIDLQGIGGDSIQSVAFPIIHRIQQEPRRIINHRCVMGLRVFFAGFLFDIQQSIQCK